MFSPILIRCLDGLSKTIKSLSLFLGGSSIGHSKDYLKPYTMEVYDEEILHRLGNELCAGGPYYPPIGVNEVSRLLKEMNFFFHKGFVSWEEFVRVAEVLPYATQAIRLRFPDWRNAISNRDVTPRILVELLLDFNLKEIQRLTN
jgi:hypothetical protein